VERIGPLEPGDGWSFAFLSPTAYVLASRGGSGALVVDAFDDTGRARCVARLGLPALRPGVRLAHVAVHSGAAVAHEDAREPFGPAPGTGVRAVSLEYASASGVRTRFALYVRARTLLRAAGDAEWDVWGPPATRVMLQLVEWGCMRHVHGQALDSPSEKVCSDRERLLVLDFKGVIAYVESSWRKLTRSDGLASVYSKQPQSAPLSSPSGIDTSSHH
jgi:hypothetical protein